jgi:hypothetical protein
MIDVVYQGVHYHFIHPRNAEKVIENQTGGAIKTPCSFASLVEGWASCAVQSGTKRMEGCSDQGTCHSPLPSGPA